MIHQDTQVHTKYRVSKDGINKRGVINELQKIS